MSLRLVGGGPRRDVRRRARREERAIEGDDEGEDVRAFVGIGGISRIWRTKDRGELACFQEAAHGPAAGGHLGRRLDRVVRGDHVVEPVAVEEERVPPAPGEHLHLPVRGDDPGLRVRVAAGDELGAEPAGRELRSGRALEGADEVLRRVVRPERGARGGVNDVLHVLREEGAGRRVRMDGEREDDPIVIGGVREHVEVAQIGRRRQRGIRWIR